MLHVLCINYVVSLICCNQLLCLISYEVPCSHVSVGVFLSLIYIFAMRRYSNTHAIYVLALNKRSAMKRIKR
jgi:hypothetical protein